MRKKIIKIEGKWCTRPLNDKNKGLHTNDYLLLATALVLVPLILLIHHSYIYPNSFDLFGRNKGQQIRLSVITLSANTCWNILIVATMIQVLN